MWISWMQETFKYILIIFYPHYSVEMENNCYTPSYLKTSHTHCDSKTSYCNNCLDN